MERGVFECVGTGMAHPSRPLQGLFLAHRSSGIPPCAPFLAQRRHFWESSLHE